MTIRKRIDKIHGFYIEDLSVGMTDIYRKIVKNKDVTLFADISGDTNPLHLDKNFARSTIFKVSIDLSLTDSHRILIQERVISVSICAFGSFGAIPN